MLIGKFKKLAMLFKRTVGCPHSPSFLVLQSANDDDLFYRWQDYETCNSVVLLDFDVCDWFVNDDASILLSVHWQKKCVSVYSFSPTSFNRNCCRVLARIVLFSLLLFEIWKVFEYRQCYHNKRTLILPVPIIASFICVENSFYLFVLLVSKYCSFF